MFLGIAITCVVDEHEGMLQSVVPSFTKGTAAQWEVEMQNWLN